uniref:Uncharacterized protein n=1 Tax=Anguilla anguilla TaxID=7936 RepID=A0A0E9SFD0_ANGAN
MKCRHKDAALQSSEILILDMKTKFLHNLQISYHYTYKIYSTATFIPLCSILYESFKYRLCSLFLPVAVQVSMGGGNIKGVKRSFHFHFSWNSSL